MNRLLIVLVIAFVSYSLGAPENIESHSADINHDLEHSSDHELEKQNGYGDGNVNSDQFPIHGCFNRGRIISMTNRDGKPRNRVAMCAALCRVACASGSETIECLKCMTVCQL
ncbi:uncharacterized protein LOC132947352 isoform X3 [Metopolophium dirhodum]|uniref:uncharacterized protein LOC132947352 isoform X3 n=1 Tax=Metopolophium dirhodum TaxID=44670 RepID=UPI00298F9662|nr:uncharacterized protein LOC132947352 isoform X3 [Metopolophium dirhodum]